MEDIDLMTAEERLEYKKTMLLETFTDKDFLECDETHGILKRNHLEKFEKGCVPKIIECYNYHHHNMQGVCATALYYDIHNSFESHLKSIVYEHIDKKLDFNIFYEKPYLAKPLIIKMSRMDEQKVVKNPVKIIKKKTFNWSTKKHINK
jgi:hypothetical protein